MIFREEHLITVETESDDDGVDDNHPKQKRIRKETQLLQKEVEELSSEGQRLMKSVKGMKIKYLNITRLLHILI